MARTRRELPAGSRITDYISLGVIAKFFPAEKILARFWNRLSAPVSASGTCRRGWQIVVYQATWYTHLLP